MKQIEKAQDSIAYEEQLKEFTKKEVVKRLGKTHTSAYIEKYLAFDMVETLYGNRYERRDNYHDDSITYMVFAFDLPSLKAKLSHYKQGTKEYLTISFNFEADDIGNKITPSGTRTYKLVKANNSGWKISDQTTKYNKK
ncbi:hypothetical protein ACQKIC_20215 [Peribacillus sp. NPDC046944]|uniref:hypothetical protein n=1 Tax=unclassified Peribacillus TaxID=2675266 RepID=UPI003D05E58E